MVRRVKGLGLLKLRMGAFASVPFGMMISISSCVMIFVARQLISMTRPTFLGWSS